MGQTKAKNHHVRFGKSRLARVALPFTPALSVGERTCWNHHHCTTNLATLRMGCVCSKTNSDLSNLSVMVARTIIPPLEPNPAESIAALKDKGVVGDFPPSCRPQPRRAAVQFLVVSDGRAVGGGLQRG